jgi:phosphatidylinositol alpha-1,6-mannosyltransferase
LIGTRGRRTYLFLHGIEAWCSSNALTRRFLERIDVFLTNSDFTWRRFLEAHPDCEGAAHRTVHLGLGEPEARIDCPGDVPAAAIVGRMFKTEGYKGHAELIRAWPLVLQRIPAAELWVVGGGDGLDDLKDLAATTGISERVRFFGLVSDTEKEELLRRSRCLVLPSCGEGFGLVYLEAMRLGRPCLSSTHDAGMEVVNPPQAGISVDPGDPRGLAEAVAELLTPGAGWQRRAENARSRYESDFTAVHFQRRLVDALLDESGV